MACGCKNLRYEFRNFFKVKCLKYGVPRLVLNTVMVVTQGDGFFWIKANRIHCVIDRYSGIEFVFAQKSLSPSVTTMTAFDTD